ncbi:MAG TPA: hypothetical protein PLJ27_01615 [Polyangiaceae bacterium]|jgi:hypothetical protein|nr:MAG: hypothetical protein BWY17_03241 [Deltaproteobacteria bacterium ADurb.Bin207]HNS98004.1 hypothetical protein [Polyangiaceae bacterium]HNZ24774.1 hypothetical protein [Polyangiaceae bacterium]HOD24482.1 hypothetical protein [Polyangiaceae bacterium]HOE50517.1 hypothetical protein [Polyangiaceae bacterium]
MKSLPIVLSGLLSGCLMMPPPQASTGSTNPSQNNAPTEVTPEEPASPTPSATAPVPSGPSVVSVKLRNTCGNTVKLFFGSKPGFSSGRFDSLGGNTSTNMQLKPGDMVWLTDENRKEISSVTVAESTREIETTCDGIRQK